jgi:hypothetical protein
MAFLAPSDPHKAIAYPEQSGPLAQCVLCRCAQNEEKIQITESIPVKVLECKIEGSDHLSRNFGRRKMSHNKNQIAKNMLLQCFEVHAPVHAVS